MSKDRKRIRALRARREHPYRVGLPNRPIAMLLPLALTESAGQPMAVFSISIVGFCIASGMSTNLPDTR